MNKLQKIKLELALAMAKFSEVITDQGSIYSENDWITTTTQVYVFDENGTLVPAPDGSYSIPETNTTYTRKEVYTVVNGVVTEVSSINTVSETTEKIPATDPVVEPEPESTEETPATDETVVEQTENVPVEQSIETPTEEVKFNKVYEMVDGLLKEIEQLKVDVDALTTTMNNAKMGRNNKIVINDATIDYNKEISPIWKIKK